MKLWTLPEAVPLRCYIWSTARGCRHLMHTVCWRAEGLAAAPPSWQQRAHQCPPALRRHVLRRALQDASFVVREMHQAVSDAAQQYDAGGPGPLRTPGEAWHGRQCLSIMFQTCTNVVVGHAGTDPVAGRTQPPFSPPTCSRTGKLCACAWCVCVQARA